MKKLIQLFLFSFLSLTVTAQNLCSLAFTDFLFENNNCDNFSIDTSSYHSNCWQIGQPQKSIFNSAYSPQHAIITDTINYYPPNDTSVFYVTGLADLGYNVGHTVILSAWYKVNSDSLNDFGTIEVSPDNGTTWIDIVNPGTYSSLIWWSTPIPTFTGNSNGWQNFACWLPSLGPAFNVQVGDTIRYRFTFISDSIQDTLDGLMFDDFHFEDWAEGIQEFGKNNFVSTAYPNPTCGNISISFENPENSNCEIKIVDAFGKEMILEKNKFGNSFILNVDSWKEGLYYYRISNPANSNYSVGKFTVVN